MSSTLDRIRIATPCPISWEQMVGDERVRFCEHCQLNVYNLSSLNRAEAETLLSSTEGRLCARLYRRSDGTVLTQDCPVGLRALRKRVSQRVAAVFALVGSLSTFVFGQDPTKKESCTPQTRITQRDIGSSSTEAILTGQVTDSFHAVVLGATVTIQNVATKKIEKTKTNEEGQFQFRITPGKYSIKIEGSGFSKYQRKTLELKGNQATNLEVILLVGEDVALIGVVAEDPNDTPGTTTISEKLLRSLPH